jgi:TolB-like protein
VSVDAGEQGADVALASWLAERPEHELELERVELAVALARRLAAEPGSALHAEAARAAALAPRERRWRNRLALGGALAAAVLVTIFMRDFTPAASAPAAPALEAARVVTFAAPRTAAAVLPTGVVVDASAIAVLPFEGAADATLAHGFERDVASSLRTVPGLYVISGAAVQPYAATGLEAEDVGAQLGARGLLEAAVERTGARVRVSARLRDAVSGATLWQADVDRPVDELGAIRDEMADGIAATMLDERLRDRLVRETPPNAAVSSSKPLLQ